MAVWVALVSVVTVVGVVGPAVGLALVLAVVVPSVVLAAIGQRAMGRRLPLPARWWRWLRSAVADEESELLVALRPRRGTAADAVVAVVALVVVVGASAVMERAASSVGHHDAVAGIVVGGLVLAAVTSLPNAVAGVYLAARGRGAALLSTTLSSNTFNVVLGLLVPATVIGVAKASGPEVLIVVWYGALTVITVAFASTSRGLRRWQGWLIVGGYVGFAVSLVALS